SFLHPSFWVEAFQFLLLRLCRSLPPDCDRTAAWSLARTGVRMSSLAPHRQSATMPQAAICSDFHKPLDIEGYFFPQIPFDSVLLFDDLAILVCLVIVQLANFCVRINACRCQDLVGLRTTNTVDIRESNLDSLVWRKIHASNTRHRLPLSLFVLRVHANHAHDALAMHDFALVANFLNGCSAFHSNLCASDD